MQEPPQVIQEAIADGVTSPRRLAAIVRHEFPGMDEPRVREWLEKLGINTGPLSQDDLLRDPRLEELVHSHRPRTGFAG